MRINIYKASGSMKVRKGEVRRLVRKALGDEGKDFSEINVILADDQYLRGLNETWFRKKHSTNVISFNLGDVAEIYISQDSASDVEELYYFILHGLLHVIGYHHRDEKESLNMEKKCLEYLAHE
jgi:probable rRNA maturation factor